MAADDGTYITVASVRRTVGIATAQISDADVGGFIDEAEPEIARFYNTFFTPTEKIEILDGDGTNRLLLNQNPLLSVRELKIEGTTEDPANLEIWKDSGYIFLGEDATASYFVNKKNQIVVKYIYGTVENSSVSTTTTAAEVAGTAVSVGVASETGFTALDWVEILGMDGKREVAQVSSTDTGILILDQLVQTHESGSTVTLLQINENFTKLMNIFAALAMVGRIVGESYTDIVGYNIDDFRVQKGEPYTQWRETAIQLIKERDLIMSRITIRPYIM